MARNTAQPNVREGPRWLAELLFTCVERGGREDGGGGSPGNFLGERLGLVGRRRRNRLIEISMRWNDIGDRIADTNLSRTELAIKLIINHE